MNADIEKLQRQIDELTRKLDALQIKVDTNQEFQNNFSGIKVFNQDVQFLQKVRKADGTIVTQINP